MPTTPGLRPERGIRIDVRAARLAERRERAERCLDVFLRIRGYAWDDTGEALWLNLAPKDEARSQQTQP